MDADKFAQSMVEEEEDTDDIEEEDPHDIWDDIREMWEDDIRVLHG